MHISEGGLGVVDLEWCLWLLVYSELRVWDDSSRIFLRDSLVLRIHDFFTVTNLNSEFVVMLTDVCGVRHWTSMYTFLCKCTQEGVHLHLQPSLAFCYISVTIIITSVDKRLY